MSGVHSLYTWKVITLNSFTGANSEVRGPLPPIHVITTTWKHLNVLGSTWMFAIDHFYYVWWLLIHAYRYIIYGTCEGPHTTGM